MSPENVNCTGDDYNMACEFCKTADNCDGPVNLIRVNNRWLVDITKEDLNKNQ